MIVRQETGTEAGAQAEDPSPNRGETSLPSASRRNANLQEDVVNLRLATAQEDVPNLVIQRADVPNQQDASNQEAETKMPDNLAMRN